MALLAGRNIAVFAVAATPVLTYHLDSVLTERGWTLKSVQRVTPGMARINLILVIVVLLGALLKVAVVLSPKTVDPALRAALPVAAVEYIEREQPPRQIFNSYNWGGYLLFAAPDYPVFVDGRTDLYGDAFLTQYLQTAIGGDGWRETLDSYGINTVLVEKESGLARQLRAEPGWQEVYTDALASIFVRES